MSTAPRLAGDDLEAELSAPVTVLWAWPGETASRWLGALADLSRARRVAASQVVEIAPSLGEGDVGVVFGALEPAAFGAAVDALAPGALWVVAGSPRPKVGAVPHRLIGPRRLAVADAPDLDLGRLDAEEKRVLQTVAAFGPEPEATLPLELWRRIFGLDPATSTALERLVGGWGLLGDHGPTRPVLQAALQIRGVAMPEDSPWLERLATSSAELGRNDLARWALREAGLGTEASRFDFAVAALPPSVRQTPTRPRSARASSTPAFRVSLLGVPDIARVGAGGTEEIVHWRLHRSLLAVARLALAPQHRLPRDELVEALFPELSADHVKRNFHPTLSAARRALGGGRAGGLVQRHGIYSLDPSVEWRIDVELFEAHLAAAAAETSPARSLSELEAAWRLYRGPLLDGFEAEWLDEPRQRQRGRYLDMLRRVGELASVLGRETLALDAYRRLLLDEPFEERIHLELMEIYGRRGRRDLVRRQFVHLQELLKDLHAEPEEETVELYHRLMR